MMRKTESGETKAMPQNENNGDVPNATISAIKRVIEDMASATGSIL
jgi:hypothetical protein